MIKKMAEKETTPFSVSNARLLKVSKTLAF